MGFSMRSFLATNFVLLFMFFGCTAGAEHRPVDENELKTAFLFNFAKHVIWPVSAFKNADTPIEFCFKGGESVAEHLKKLIQKQKIDGRYLEVHDLEKTDSYEKCQMLFVSGVDKKETSILLYKLRTLPIFTVGDSPGFLEQGGAVRLFIKDGKIGFDVNLGATELNHLDLSFRLLQLANSVRRIPYSLRNF